MTFEITIRRHVVRLVTTDTDYGSGMYRPGIRAFLKGPNNSPAGIGPKSWPSIGRKSWSNCIYIPVPYITWGFAYKYRRLGAIKLYQLVRKGYKKIF